MASFVARLLRLGDDRPPTVDITAPANLSTQISAFNNATGFFEAGVTFTALATDPDGDAIVSYNWDREGTALGTGNPLNAALRIPTAQPSAQPYITVIATDSTGLLSGDQIQVKVILPSPSPSPSP